MHTVTITKKNQLSTELIKSTKRRSTAKAPVITDLYSFERGRQHQMQLVEQCSFASRQLTYLRQDQPMQNHNTSHSPWRLQQCSKPISVHSRHHTSHIWYY